MKMSNDTPKNENAAEAETVEVYLPSNDTEKNVQYEQGGLRTYVEGVDHSTYNSVSIFDLLSTLDLTEYRAQSPL